MLTPGALLERGRYRLVAEVGRDDRCAAQLWQGRDLMLERDVALTLFIAAPHAELAPQHSTANGAGKQATARTEAAESHLRCAVQRALRSARLVTPGAARVLDVLDPDSSSGPTIAAVVAEWTPGRALGELIRDELAPPSVAASLLVPLAGAVDTAHRAGLILGCDHPQRIRVTPEGRARLAFPGPPPDTGPQDDIRGLGAVLYLLLTGYWPLPDPPVPPGGPGPPVPPGGLTPAPLGRDGAPVSPRALRPEVPVELSALALRCLAGTGTGGVHTGAAVQRVLELHAATDYPESASAGDDQGLSPEQVRKRRRFRLGVSVAALVGATLLILGYLGMQLASMFTAGPSGPALIVGGPPSAAPANPTPPAPGPPPAPPAGPIPVADLSVYDISGRGSPDNQEDVGLLVDGDPSTGWSTDSYFQPFPAFKQGLGVMLRFERPVAVSSVTVESPSAGTVLEVRTAPAPDAPLDQTTVVGKATLAAGSTPIQLQPGPPTQYLLLWITELSGGGEHNRSKLSEIGVQQRAS
ncbi:MAG TPA: protein kinase family protein [Pseudonocardiaceae bacterium]|nr:protein kinase family protein [Pseudonocardiaceae bacterium]